jgi:hypothetical protein
MIFISGKARDFLPHFPKETLKLCLLVNDTSEKKRCVTNLARKNSLFGEFTHLKLPV